MAILWFLSAGLAWVLGLLGLFVVGKLLSFATLRSARTADPNAAITPLQQALRGLYRNVIRFASLYYYLSLPLLAAFSLAAAGGFLYGVFLLPRIPVKLIAVAVVFGVAMLATIGSSIRSLFVRIPDEDPGRALTEAEAPRLWALAREVADRLGTRPVDVIFLTEGTELAVFERGGWLAKWRDRARRSLILGQGVVDGFRLDAFRAVLAHEYGHFQHRDTAGGEVALRVNASMGRFATAMIERGNAAWWNLNWHFVRLYHWLFRRITHGASRLQEINADRVAARAYGRREFEEGLRHVIRRDVAERYRRALADRGDDLDAPAGPTPDRGQVPADRGLAVPEIRRRCLRAEIRQQVESAVATLWQAETTEDDTHPGPAERVRLLERLRETGGPPSGAGGAAASGPRFVADLLGEPGDWESVRADRRATEARQRAEARSEYFGALLGPIDGCLAEHPDEVEPLRHRAAVRMQLEDFAGAAADYSRAIRPAAPDLALSHYGRAQARLKLEDWDGAAEDLRAAMGLDPSLESERADGAIDLGDALLGAGRVEEAITAYTRALELEPERLAIRLRLGEASALLGDLPAAESAATQALERDPGCAEALAGRALARAHQGRLAEARADAAKALAIEPTLGADHPPLRSLADGAVAEPAGPGG